MIVTVPVKMVVGIVLHPSIEEQKADGDLVLVNEELIALTQLETVGTAVHVLFLTIALDPVVTT